MKKKRKDRTGIIYSTATDFDYEYEGSTEEETLPPAEQKLRIQLDKKSRGGKQVTLITGFIGSEQDLKSLGKVLKSKCGVGGSAKDSEIIIQGDFRGKVKEILEKEGYPAKLIGS